MANIMFTVCLKKSFVLLIFALFFLSACAMLPPPTPLLTQPNIEVIPRLFDFSDVEVGRIYSIDVVVKNSGKATLKIEKATVTGRNFSKQADMCLGQSLMPNSSCVIEVRFAPDSPGSFSGKLRILSNDPDENLVEVSLKGVGKPPLRPNIEVTTKSLDFGRIEVGRTSSLDLTVRNSGNANLTIKEVVVRGAGFSKQEDRCSERDIAPNRSCTITVGFAPSSAASFPGILSILSNDPDENSLVISLNGTGIPLPTGPEPPRPPKGKVLPPPCSPENLGIFTHDGIKGTLKIKTGAMKRGSCGSYSLYIQRRGDLVIYITHGYSLSGHGIEFTGESRFENDPTRYKRYSRLRINDGTYISDIRITREVNSPNNFRFIFKLFPR